MFLKAPNRLSRRSPIPADDEGGALVPQMGRRELARFLACLHWMPPPDHAGGSGTDPVWDGPPTPVRRIGCVSDHSTMAQ